MTWLASRLASGRVAPQRSGAPESIAGGRLAAVGTVLSEPLFKFGNSCFELGYDDLMALLHRFHLTLMTRLLFVEQPHEELPNQRQTTLFKG